VVQELSSQNLNLRKWLRSGGIDPDNDVRVVVIPSALTHAMMQAGHLDGYCVAEPWNTAAAMDGTGWTVVATSEVEPAHPEKVLLVLQDFAEKREEEHLRMIVALIEASQFCDQPENRSELARMLARPSYFDVDRKLLANMLVGPFEFGHGRRPIKDFVLYDATKLGAPTRATGKWVFDLVLNLGGNGSHPALRSEIIPKIFREDIFHKAVKLGGTLNGRQRTAPLFCPADGPRVPTAPEVQSIVLTPATVLPANDVFQNQPGMKPPVFSPASNDLQKPTTALCV
jgi:hypothetical protein